MKRKEKSLGRLRLELTGLVGHAQVSGLLTIAPVTVLRIFTPSEAFLRHPLVGQLIKCFGKEGWVPAAASAPCTTLSKLLEDGCVFFPRGNNYIYLVD